MDNTIKYLLVIVLVLLGVYLTVHLAFPILGAVAVVLWGLAGLVAGLLHLVLFAALGALVIYGLLLLAVYIREQIAG